MRRLEVLTVLLILAVAVGFRFFALETVPGLHVREAIRGLAIASDHGMSGVFANIQALSVGLLGHTAFALRLPAALAGILTVFGIYLLARRLFDNRELAAMAAFFAATGFWHVTISRVGFATVMPAFWATLGIYYLYKGIETHRLWHWGLAGLAFGLGVRGVLDFWVILVVVVVTLLAWWWGLRSVFHHGKYEHARHQALGGVASMLGVLILTALPFFTMPAEPSPMFGFAGQPPFFWAVTALLTAGILHAVWRVGHSLRRRGHPGVPHVLLLGWLVLAFLPGLLTGSVDLSRALVLAAPAAYLLTALGLHWLTVWLRKWYAIRDKHQICLPFERFTGRHCVGEGVLLVSIATVAFLLAIGVVDGGRYFQDWAHDTRTTASFSVEAHSAAVRITELPPAVLKYVVSDRPEAVQYLTGTGTPEEQEVGHIVYLTEEDFSSIRLPRDSIVIHLDE